MLFKCDHFFFHRKQLHVQYQAEISSVKDEYERRVIKSEEKLTKLK